MLLLSEVSISGLCSYRYQRISELSCWLLVGILCFVFRLYISNYYLEPLSARRCGNKQGLYLPKICRYQVMHVAEYCAEVNVQPVSLVHLHLCQNPVLSTVFLPSHSQLTSKEQARGHPLSLPVFLDNSFSGPLHLRGASGVR